MLSQVGMIYEECTQVFKSLLSDYVRPTGPGTVVSSRTAAMGHECSVFPSKIVENGVFRWTAGARQGRVRASSGHRRALPAWSSCRPAPSVTAMLISPYMTSPRSMELSSNVPRKSLVMRRRQNPDHLPIPPPLQVVLAATSRLAGRARC